MIKGRILSFILSGAMVLSMIPTNIMTKEVGAADTWRSALYPENWQPGYVNSSGQFLHDFSYAGYEKGEKEIPTEMSGLYANVLNYGADSTGKNDSTSAIQSAINAVEEAGGGTVYLPEGTYKVKPSSSEYASALRIKGSNIIFKGAGEGKTFIRCYAENMRFCQVINVSPNGGTWDSADDGKYYYISQDIPSAPTTTIHLNSVGSLSVGDWIIIRSDRTQSWIDEHGMGGFWYASVNPTTMGTTFYRQVTSVNTSNNTIEIDIPTRYYMKTRDNARVYKVTPKQRNVGLMNFSIGNKANSNTSGWGEEDYKTSGNGSYNVNNAFLIKFALNVNCFAKNISSYAAENSNGYHMSSNGLDISKTRSLTVENCDFSHPQYEGGGGNGYGMNICGQETLIKDCSSTSARHSYSFKYSYTNGNVIYHYTSTNPKYGSDFHMYLSMSNLIDNQELNGDYIESNVRPYGGTAGNRHGHTSSQTVFWNTKGNYYKSGMSYIIDSRQYGYGYIIGTQGSATSVKTTSTTMSSTYGTVNTTPEDYKEGIGNGQTLYPQSLYYDQLERRLNKKTGEINRDYEVKKVPGTFNAGDYYTASSEIVTNTTASGTKYVGNLVEGSTLTYKVNVEKAGYYNIAVNAISGNSNQTRKLTFSSDGEELLTMTTANGTDWEAFQQTTGKLYLANTGEHILKLVSTGAINIADITFDRAENNPIEIPAYTSDTQAGRRVVGYLPSYRTYTIDSIDYSALTHLCLAFMTYANGTCASGFSASDVQKIVQKCHDNGVKVLIAIGGGGGFNTSDGPFNTAAQRTSIVNQIMNYVNQYNLDGVDIDIEVTDSNVWANFDIFCKEMSSRLKSQNKLYTMAVSSWFTGSIQNSTYDYFDFVNLMTYDENFGDGPVASMSMVNNMISHYASKGVSNDRMVIGVPFYGYASGAKAYAYSEIITMNSDNRQLDYYNGIYYNGENTIREKAELSKNYGGTMIWELGQDSFGTYSLLNVIKNVMAKGVTGGTTTTPTVTTVPGIIPVSAYGNKTDKITFTTENGVTYAGNLNNGSTLEYYINVPSSGEYTVTLKLAAGDAKYNADNMIVKINDNDVTEVPVQASTSWTTFLDHTTTVTFTQAGNYKLSVMSQNGACNITDITVSKKGEAVTEAPTEASTQAPETTIAEPVDQPEEVFGVVLSSNSNNTITVVWGRNTKMEEKGQLYNVYVDGTLKLTNKVCASYDISNIPAGTYTVKVTSVLGHNESAGFEEIITVNGESVIETTKEEETTKVQPVAAVEINGWQISTSAEGFRVIYSVSDVNEEVEEAGMIYGLGDSSSEADMVVGSLNNTVFSYKATEAGKLSASFGELESSQSYAMTMKFIKSREFYKRDINVRAYVRLKNGSYIYSDVMTNSVYDISDFLYTNQRMNTITNHNYLYNNILTIVNPSYKVVDYEWNNTIINPDEI